MIMQTIPLAELNQQIIQLLYKEVGIVNTLRFLQQYQLGYGNYVENRHALFDGMSIDDLSDEIDRLALNSPDAIQRLLAETA